MECLDHSFLLQENTELFCICPKDNIAFFQDLGPILGNLKRKITGCRSNNNECDLRRIINREMVCFNGFYVLGLLFEL
jgi:hypothetical protein